MMKNVIPDFKSTLSIFPYFLNSLSTSDCLASKSRFPQKIGFIFPNASATNLQCNVRKNGLLRFGNGEIERIVGERRRRCGGSEDPLKDWYLFGGR